MNYIVVLGELKIKNRSKEETDSERLQKMLTKLNDRFRLDMEVSFFMEGETSFRGILKRSENLFQIIKIIQFNLSPAEARFGIGIGKMDRTETFTGSVIGTSGTAIEIAKVCLKKGQMLEKELGAQVPDVVVSSEEDNDERDMLLMTFMLLLQTIEKRWTISQREIMIERLKPGADIEDIAINLGISKETISDNLKQASYYAYSRTIVMCKRICEKILS